ncbi:MAG: hypothetical protein QOI83_3024 [Streptomycetaceae bacterium]|nr:hypothetical protein [Streptomycetaceae bacterium]
MTSLEALTAELAEQLPYNDIKQLAHACRNGRTALRALEAQVAGAPVRAACRRLLACTSHDTQGEYAAGLLLGSAQTLRRQHSGQQIDVVWTGPPSKVRTSRLTSAVVSELIDTAQSELLLVSYATFPPQSLTSALTAATARGVTVVLLLERSADNTTYQGGHPLATLPAIRWTWPAANRPPGASLHAKIIVVDRRVVLVGSANLTGNAFEKNLECGILLHDPTQADAIARHLESLRESGILLTSP